MLLCTPQSIRGVIALNLKADRSLIARSHALCTMSKREDCRGGTEVNLIVTVEISRLHFDQRSKRVIACSRKLTGFRGLRDFLTSDL
jgi:hypothetical protein